MGNRYRIADLDSEGQSQIVAYGGEGGSAVTNEYFNGLKGDSCRLILELKSIADIGEIVFFLVDCEGWAS